MITRLLAVLLLASLAASCGDDGDVVPPTVGPSRTVSHSPAPTASSPLAPGPTNALSPTATISGGTPYTVRPGDTLFSIAQRFGTTVEAIQAANNIDDPTVLAVGQVLIISGGATAPRTLAPTEPPSGEPAQVIRIGSTSRRQVAFTFDAGSDAGYTTMILDTLATNGLKVSFGMTGKWAESYPDLLKRMVNEGHTLINHSYNHPSFTDGSTDTPPLTQAERWEQLDSTEATVQRLTGATTMPYFRPPFGAYDESVNADVGAKGYAYNVMWTIDSRGWMGISAPEITSRCLQLAEPGAIYVFHVGAASEDGPALQSLIDGLRADGYTIGDINDILAP